MKRVIFVIVLFFPLVVKALLSYPYYLTSPNGEYYLKSIPHADQIYTEYGRTDVFRTIDSTLVYTIDRYLLADGVLLSNDGESVFYINANVYSYDDFDDKIVKIYKMGDLFRTYTVEDIIEKKMNYYYYVLYSESNATKFHDDEQVYLDLIPEYERKLIESPTFTDGINAFIVTTDNELIEFSFQKGEIVNRQPLNNSINIINTKCSSKKVFKPDFDNPGGTFSIPLLSDSRTYQKAFEEQFGYKQNDAVREEYGTYTLKLACFIDHNGACIDAAAYFSDTTLNQNIVDFFKSIKFDPDAVPEIVENWYFFHSSIYRKKDTAIALKEGLKQKRKKREHNLWRQRQDTLDGAYIPKNLEDCFRELDLILSDKSKEEIIKSESIKFHFGLGRNLRNRWGLWSGSRLQNYFYSLGIDHPDSMSSFILENYKKYLKGIPLELEKQLERYSPRPEIIYENNLEKNKKK